MIREHDAEPRFEQCEQRGEQHAGRQSRRHVLRGGGRPDLAQAGGPDGAKADAALTAIEKAMAGP